MHGGAFPHLSGNRVKGMAIGWLIGLESGLGVLQFVLRKLEMVIFGTWWADGDYWGDVGNVIFRNIYLFSARHLYIYFFARYISVNIASKMRDRASIFTAILELSGLVRISSAGRRAPPCPD